MYRDIPVGDLPDADWVADQTIPDDVRNVYDLWSQRRSIEITPTWYDANAAPAGVGAAVHDAVAVEVQPVERKRVPITPVTVGDTVHSHYVVIVNATGSSNKPAFEKVSLEDTSADQMFLRIVAATPPVGATHLRLLAEVTT